MAFATFFVHLLADTSVHMIGGVIRHSVYGRWQHGFLLLSSSAVGGGPTVEHSRSRRLLLREKVYGRKTIISGRRFRIVAA
jgi:hypothetical protein